MNQQHILLELQEIFRKTFRVNTLEINLNTDTNDIALWDSLSHLELTTAIERKFKITFTLDEVMSFESVGEIFNCIQTKLNK